MTSRDHPSHHPSHGHCDVAQAAVELVAVWLLLLPGDQHQHEAVAEVEEQLLLQSHAAVGQQLLLQHSSMGLEPHLVGSHVLDAQLEP